MNQEAAETIARQILDGAGLERKVTVEVYDFHSGGREPSLRESHDNQILIEACHPSEVRHLTGRYAVKETWPFHKWYVADRPYLVGLAGFALILTISALQFLLGLTLPQYMLSIAIAADTAIAGGVIGFSYLISLRHTLWRRHLIVLLSSLGTLTEYEGKKYEITYYPGGMTWPALCIPAILMVLLRTEIPRFGFNVYPPIILLLTIVASAPSLFIGLNRPNADEPCWGEIGDDEGELNELTEDEEGAARELENLIADEIERVELQNLFKEETQCNTDHLQVIFRTTRFPQCRWFSYYEDDSRLTFEIHDIGVEPAKRLAIVRLRRLATPLFSQTSLRRRMLILFNLIFVIAYWIAVVLVGTVLGIPALQVLILAGAIILGYSTRLNVIMHRESQNVFHELLEESEYLTDFDREYYYDEKFGDAVRADMGILWAYALFAIIAELLVLWSLL
jgi:hypothetical protein